MLFGCCGRNPVLPQHIERLKDSVGGLLGRLAGQLAPFGEIPQHHRLANGDVYTPERAEIAPVGKQDGYDRFLGHEGDVTNAVVKLLQATFNVLVAGAFGEDAEDLAFVAQDGERLLHRADVGRAPLDRKPAGYADEPAQEAIA